MGLDMYVWAIPANQAKDLPQVDAEIPEDRVDFMYWRKHHDLHGWMARLYEQKGGKDQSFNCNTVRLMPEDLDALESAIKEEGDVLPVTTGFFFGNNPPDDESRKRDLEFISKARTAIVHGMALYYDSWW